MTGVRWTEEQLADFERRRGTAAQRSFADTSAPPFQPPARPDDALGRLPAGKMNKTEARYADYLAGEQAAGRIRWFKFEAIKLRLADRTTYTPDFPVLTASGAIEFHEVKGFWRAAARVKIKVAAELFPFRFVAVTRRAGGWQREEFP